MSDAPARLPTVSEADNTAHEQQPHHSFQPTPFPEFPRQAQRSRADTGHFSAMDSHADNASMRQPDEAIADMQHTTDSIGNLSLARPPSQSSNPTSVTSDRLRFAHDHRQSLRQLNQPQRRNTDPDTFSPSRRSMDASEMSAPLPEDDGMRMIRAKMHEIREMALSSEEKAKRMHHLMTAEYRAFQQQKQSRAMASVDFDGHSRLRSLSPLSIGSGVIDPENPYNIQPGDKEATYAPLDPSDEIEGVFEQDENRDDVEVEPDMGCKHYKRNVKVQCPDCQRWYTCRFCHDEEMQDHKLERKRIRNMMCMYCATPQRAAEYCKKCDQLTACYYCSECKLWDNDATHKIYHCDECGICRRGAGLGKDFVHCKKCNVCISIAWAAKHRCVEGATERDCPICGEYMFSSSASVVAMKCGHYIHRQCYDAHMQSSYKCPICNHSAVNMELQWRKMDRAIEEQPMPEKYRNTKAWIMCNDCSCKATVSYHWLGNKCDRCDSYNTQELKLIDSPDETTRDDADTEQGRRMAHEAGRLMARPENAPSPEPIPIHTSLQARLHDASRPSTGHSNILARAHSPAYTNTTTLGSPRSAIFTSAGHSAHSSVDDADPPSPVAPTPTTATAEQEPEEMAFWGDTSNPVTSWLASPRSWTAPSFLASRFGAEAPSHRRIVSDSREASIREEEEATTDEPARGRSVFPAAGWTSPSFLAARPLESTEVDTARRPNSWGPTGWTLPGPPRWAQDRFFFGAAQAPSAAAPEHAEGQEDQSGGRGWRIPTIPGGPWSGPKFLTDRFGVRAAAAAQRPDSKGGEEELREEGESEYGEDDDDEEDDGFSLGESEHGLEEDSMHLFGHR